MKKHSLVAGQRDGSPVASDDEEPAPELEPSPELESPGLIEVVDGSMAPDDDESPPLEALPGVVAPLDETGIKPPLVPLPSLGASSPPHPTAATNTPAAHTPHRAMPNDTPWKFFGITRSPAETSTA